MADPDRPGAPDLDWGDYAPLDVPATGPLRDAPRAEAEATFAALMAARAARRDALAALAARHGVALDPGAVGAWLVRALGAAGPGALGDPRWAGVIADVALWLGDRVIAAAPHLRWELFTSHKKATGYQRAVLVGFRNVTDARYYVDVAFMVGSWAELAARRRAVKPDFLATIEQVTLADA